MTFALSHVQVLFGISEIFFCLGSFSFTLSILY